MNNKPHKQTMSITETVLTEVEIEISLSTEGEFCVNGEVVCFINDRGALELDYLDEGFAHLQTEHRPGDGGTFIKVIR